MKQINVNIEKKYSIYSIESFDDFDSSIFDFKPYKNIMIITDDNVYPKYYGKLEKLIPKSCLSYSYIISNGEKSKCLSQAETIIDQMVKCGFHRNDLIIALGGGVVGDLSGFVASIFMRGISFIQIPTTLLAAVDASIGGKTAVDIACGKNLVGTFWQPKAVIQINSIIKELDNSILYEGISEVIKYGVIYDSTIIDLVEEDLYKNIDLIIYKCMQTKVYFVSNDEKEMGLRKILNFGHTFAHAVEECSSYTISHGVAVAYGIVFELYLGMKLNKCSKEYYEKISNIVYRFFNKYDYNFTADAMVNVMKYDKKNENTLITFVIPNGNENLIESIAPEKVEQILRSFMGEI